jgi:hypothetical protein
MMKKCDRHHNWFFYQLPTAKRKNTIYKLVFFLAWSSSNKQPFKDKSKFLISVVIIKFVEYFKQCQKIFTKFVLNADVKFGKTFFKHHRRVVIVIVVIKITRRIIKK